jgi:hypothetical protein
MVEVNESLIDKYEQIYDEEHNYDDDYEQEVDNNTYHLGICSYDKDIDGWLLASTIKNRTLFNYPYCSVVDYLNNYSVIEQGGNVPTDIMYLSFQGDEPFQLYTVIKKTFWLKLIQRTWKKICQQRKQIIKSGNMTDFIRQRELGLQKLNIPTLHGMLSYLKDNK